MRQRGSQGPCGKVTNTADASTNSTQFAVGGDDYVEFTDRAAFAPGGSNDVFSLFCWVRFSEVDASNQMAVANIWGGSDNQFWFALLDDAGQAEMIVYVANAGGDSSNYVWTTTGNMTTNTWYHVGFVYNGASGTPVRTYKNATQPSQATNGTIPATMRNSSRSLLIGNQSALTNDLPGFIDECFAWRSALSAANVSTIYNSGTPSNDATQGLSPDWGSRMGENGRFPCMSDEESSEHGTVNNTTAAAITTTVPP